MSDKRCLGELAYETLPLKFKFFVDDELIEVLPGSFLFYAELDDCDTILFANFRVVIPGCSNFCKFSHDDSRD